MIGALVMTFHRGPAALLASIPSSAQESCNYGFSGTCTNNINITCTPVGGSGSFAFNWEFVENDDNFSMFGSQSQTVSLSKQAGGSGPEFIYTCIVRCLVTDNVGGEQTYSNECTVTSTHFSSF